MIQLSCATICAEAFTYQGFENTFAMLPAAGYSCAEFNLWHSQAMRPDIVQGLVSRCREHGLKASSVHTLSWGAPSDQDIAKDVSHKLWMMHVAQELGCRLLCATGHSRQAPQGLDRAIVVLREIMPVAEAQGMKISLENHRGNDIEFIEDYEKVFEAVPSDNLGCCLDTGHFDASGVKMDELIDRIGAKVNHIHVKENRGFGTQHFTRFGEGTTDNHHVIRRMIEIGYEGFIVVEISPQKDRPTSVEDLRVPVRMFQEFTK